MSRAAATDPVHYVLVSSAVRFAHGSAYERVENGVEHSQAHRPEVPMVWYAEPFGHVRKHYNLRSGEKDCVRN